MRKHRIYIIGSLRSERVIEVTTALSAQDWMVFSDWFGAGPEADDYWQKYEKARGRTYREALQSPAAQNVFAFDLRHLLASDMAVMVGPAGKSAHLELGFMAGRGKPTFILMDEPGADDRWDVMALFAGYPINDENVQFTNYLRIPRIAYNTAELVEEIKTMLGRSVMDLVPDNPKVKH